MTSFPALTSRRHGTETVLTGFLDRSALYGVLAEIEALGLNLLELRQLEPRSTRIASAICNSLNYSTPAQDKQATPLCALRVANVVGDPVAIQ
jgi:hypothetical protein